MADPRGSRQQDGAAPAVLRRDVARWLALGVIGLHAGDLAAQTATSITPRRPGHGPVTFLDAATLRRTLQAAPEENAGQPGLYSLDLSPESGAQVIGIRRTIVTRSELHEGFTDVWYVLEGSGVLVTGGTIVEGVQASPGEIRGRSIAGGDLRKIRTGDFAVVPAGTPHWVSRVEAPELLYMVVKVPTD